MDLLIEADAQAEVQEAVFFAIADLLNLEVDVLLFDTASTCFQRDTEEAPTEAARPARHDHVPTDCGSRVLAALWDVTQS